MVSVQACYRCVPPGAGVRSGPIDVGAPHSSSASAAGSTSPDNDEGRSPRELAAAAMLLETHARPTVFPNDQPPPFVPVQRQAPAQLPLPAYYQPHPGPPCQAAPFGLQPQWNQTCSGPTMAMYGAYGQGYPCQYMQAVPYLQHAPMTSMVPTMVPAMLPTMPFQSMAADPVTQMPFPPAARPVVAAPAPAPMPAPAVPVRPVVVAPAVRAQEVPAATAPSAPALTPTQPPLPAPPASPKEAASKPAAKVPLAAVAPAAAAAAPSPSKEPAAASGGAGGPIAAAPQRRRARAEGPGKQGWTVEEDQTILRMVEETGQKWSSIAVVLPGRTDDAVRNRFLRLQRKAAQGEKRGDMWTAEEDKQIREAVQINGLKWHEIAAELNGRSANAVRNRYLRCMAASAAKPDSAPEPAAKPCPELTAEPAAELAAEPVSMLAPAPAPAPAPASPATTPDDDAATEVGTADDSPSLCSPVQPASPTPGYQADSDTAVESTSADPNVED